jgi:hypothetical protein
MYTIAIALLSSSITAGQGGSTMADQDFGKGDKFWEVIQRKEIYESLRPLLNEVKEAQEYEDEHGMDNWGAVIPNCLVSRMAMVIIKNLK